MELTQCSFMTHRELFRLVDFRSVYVVPAF